MPVFLIRHTWREYLPEVQLRASRRNSHFVIVTCNLQESQPYFLSLSSIFPSTATTWPNRRAVWRLDASVFSSTPGDVTIIGWRKIHLSHFKRLFLSCALFAILTKLIQSLRAISKSGANKIDKQKFRHSSNARSVMKSIIYEFYNECQTFQ